MSDTRQSQSPSSGAQSEFARNEGGCARVFMFLVAIIAPWLSICVSVVYRTIGYRTMARRLLWFSVVMLVLQLIVAVVVVILIGSLFELILDLLSEWLELYDQLW